MGKYCDSAVLEKNWFHWLLSSEVPCLEKYRDLGILWSKPLSKLNAKLPDPMHKDRMHCLALGKPVFIKSVDGDIKKTYVADGKRKKKVSLSYVDSELNLLSDSWIHNLDTPGAQITEVIPRLKEEGYFCELPTDKTWKAMLVDINNMCHGIAMKFNQRTEEEQHNLAHEALIQVIRKLESKRLVYTPGRAPVFNLLTTTIHRCMFSIMNKRSSRYRNSCKLVSDIQAGVLPDYMRSIRVSSKQTIKSQAAYSVK